MEMADTIVINKADGDNIPHNSRNQSSTEPYISFKKVRLDYNCNLQCNYTRRIPEVWETITKFIELTKSNDYFNEKRLERRYQRTIEGFYNNTEIQNLR
jgi:LAO/AO transport system kinase